ncbi:MAG: hypothetical protein JEZ09_16830 [Salinivirgaceae bacterium]|nr:hypothetical protein [Salinivirgaceae bacterium]
MKKQLLLLLIGVTVCMSSLGQSHNGFKYQAVLRDNDGKVIADEELALRISILQGSESGSIIYTEEHQKSTNAVGLVHLNIGTGNVLLGDFVGINWGSNDYFMQIELNRNNEGFVVLGISPLLSVPYAIHAESVTNNDDADADPLNEIQTLSIQENTIYLSDGGFVELPESSGFSGDYNDLTNQPNLEGDVTGELNQSSVDKLKGRELSTNTPANGQVLKWDENLQQWVPSDDALGAAGSTDGVVSSVGFSGTDTKKLTLNRSNGLGALEATFTDQVADADADPSNELQIISILNDSIYLSNGGAIKLPESFSGNYNDLVNKPVLAGDVTGNLEENLVIKIQGKDVSTNNPGNGQVLKWNNSEQKWIPSDDALGAAGTTDGVVESISVSGDVTKTITLIRSNSMSSIYATFTDNVDDADANPSNEIQDIELNGTNLSITSGGTVDLSTIQDGYEANTDEQTLTIEDDSLAILNGNKVDLLPYKDNTDEQQLYLFDQELTISNGNTIDLSVLPDSVIDDDANPVNEIQYLTASSDSLKISGAGGIAWPNGMNLFTTDGANVLLPNGNLGLGTGTPTGKLEVKGNAVDTPDDLLFGVINNNGDTIFAVYQEGVRIYVNDSPTKAIGSRGGFAVGGYSSGKGTLTNEYLRVTPDSVRIYVDETNAKALGSRGGFAVGGYSSGKGIGANEYLRVTPDSVRIYVDESSTKALGSRGGFAVGGYSSGWIIRSKPCHSFR